MPGVRHAAMCQGTTNTVTCFQGVSCYGGRRPASALALSPSTQAASITTKRRFYFQRAVKPIMCSRSSNIADVFWRKLLRRQRAVAVWLVARRRFLFLLVKTSGTHDHVHVRSGGEDKTTGRQPPSFWTRRWTESFFNSREDSFDSSTSLTN